MDQKAQYLSPATATGSNSRPEARARSNTSAILKSVWSKVMPEDESRTSSPGGNGASGNCGVDYVISFRFGKPKDKQKAAAQFKNLIAALDRVGLRTEARDGGDGNILVFARVRSSQRLVGEVYRSRVKDWLHGVRPAAPDHETQRSLDKEPLTDAERLRIVYSMITLPETEGGAGITPKKGQWSFVESIFPLHDRQFNKELMRRWSTRWLVNTEELGKLRDMFGEKVAFYFAFLQCYFSFCVIAAVLGASAYFVLPPYSLVFTVANCLWSVIFVEYWKKQEVDLAVGWNVRKVSQMQNKRAQFRPEKEVEDPVTGEIVKTFPAWKRLLRQCAQIPFALGAGAILSALFAGVFAIEIFISEVYHGPFQSVLVFLPTVILSVSVPLLTGFLTNIATWMTDFENYENEAAYERAMTQKVFVFNFITSYVPLFLTAFVYVPFGNLIVPHLDILGHAAQPVASADEKEVIAPTAFQINPDRLRKQFIYFTVTAQVVSLFMELFVPVLKRKALRKAKAYQAKRRGEQARYVNDHPDEKAFLEKVRGESELEEYDVNSDLREMCMQYGYLTLFSPIWPLAAVSFLINNWVETRSDAAKICIEQRRPVPHRADSIGPWLDNLGFLSWMGSISSAALMYLFSDPSSGQSTPNALTISGILLSIVLSEHVYFIARMCVRMVLDKMQSPGLMREQRERYMVRKRFLQESLGVDEETEYKGATLEIDGSGDEAFWDRQRGAQGTLDAGLEIIDGSKKGQ